MLDITDVRVHKSTKDGNIKGYASITISGCFVVHNLTIIEGKDGLFVGMPSRKSGEEFRDIAHPLDKDTRSQIQERVLMAYRDAE